MLSPILAFRPARVAEKLGRQSAVCALSPGELLAPAAALGIALPVVRAPVAAVARGALVAAKEHAAPLGLALPAGSPGPDRWFDAVAAAAEEVAGGLPIFLAGEVVVAGEGERAVERAREEAWSLVEAGVTHLALDPGAVAPEARAEVLASLAEPALERGLAVELTIGLEELGNRGARAAALLDGLRRAGLAPAIVGVRCPPADSTETARAQAGLLGRLAELARGVAIMRRGPFGEAIATSLSGVLVRLVEDGGAAAARAEAALPARLQLEAPGPRGEGPLALAAPRLTDEERDRLEARAYVEAFAFLERLGVRGTAPGIVRALARRLGPDGR